MRKEYMDASKACHDRGMHVLGSSGRSDLVLFLQDVGRKEHRRQEVETREQQYESTEGKRLRLDNSAKHESWRE
jgi:hypothetical protein